LTTATPDVISGLTWAISAGVICIALIAIGVAVQRRLLGILVDSRNKMSLSRLQVILWTILFVSAFFAIAIKKGTMNIYLGPELWALMGIATGSAAGSSIIKGTKAAQEPAPRLGIIATPRIGVLSKASRPRFSDMFKGEEVTDSDYVDVSKLQMFFFTIAALLGYVMVLSGYHLDTIATGISGYDAYFPPMSNGLVTLVGISHAGYLTVKAAPHTPTT
jgi:hypothetical protein